MLKNLATKLLLVSIVPVAGYGGYCVYDNYYQPFIEREGYEIAPIDGDLGSDQIYKQKKKQDCWRSSRRFKVF